MQFTRAIRPQNMIESLDISEVKAFCTSSLAATCVKKIVHQKKSVPQAPSVPDSGPISSSNDEGLTQATAFQCSLFVKNARNLGPWKIFLSGNAVQNWRQHGKTGSLNMIAKKIHQSHLQCIHAYLHLTSCVRCLALYELGPL